MPADRIVRGSPGATIGESRGEPWKESRHDQAAPGQGVTFEGLPGPLLVEAPVSPLLRLSLFSRDIKLSHSIFALPFALLSAFLAAHPGRLKLGQLLLIVLCMVTARTVAMGSNRLLDAELDRRNPRTAGRAIPSGKLSRAFVIGMTVACALAFVAATSLFGFMYGNWLPLVLSLPVLLFIAGYPLLKRFTQLCHYYLGAALALAPICAWIAIKGSLSPFWDAQKGGVSPFSTAPYLMAAAVLCWTAGFDIIYACQDYASDVAEGVFSVPAKIGIGPALWVSRATHALAVAFLIALGLHAAPPLGTLYFIGVACCIVLLVVEHSIVRPDDLSKVGLAFFTINGIISIMLGTLGIIDVLT